MIFSGLGECELNINFFNHLVMKFLKSYLCSKLIKIEL